jgi:hypothetical protein
MVRPILTRVSLAVLLVASAVALAQSSEKDRPKAARDGGAETGDTAPPRAPATREAPQPSADEVLGQMLKPRRTGNERELVVTDPPGVDRTSGRGAVVPNAPVVNVLREGSPIVNRVGRLSPGADGGAAEFTFESDGQALRDPPLLILPNLKLMLMEDSVRNANRELRFRVTGIVTEYRGRNYLLLEKVSVLNPATQQLK